MRQSEECSLLAEQLLSVCLSAAPALPGPHYLHMALSVSPTSPTPHPTRNFFFFKADPFEIPLFQFFYFCNRCECFHPLLSKILKIRDER